MANYASLDLRGKHREFVSRLAYHLFKRIYNAFLQKSTGNADSLGLRWKPLKPETIAQRPITPADRVRWGITKEHRYRGLLTASQDARWRAIFRSIFSRLMLTESDEREAKATAAKIAWSILKREGALTKIATLGTRNVPILIRTGRLLESLKPQPLVNGEYIPSADQVFRWNGKLLEIGTSVPYAAYQHKTRRLWPKRIDAWVESSISESLDEMGIRNRVKFKVVSS